MTETERIAAAVAILTGSASAPGPGRWWGSPGAPYTPGESAADNPTRAKELAAQNKRVNGDHGSIADSDFDQVLLIADFIGADTRTAAEAENKVDGAATTGTDSAIYQVVLGQVNGDLVTPGLGGRARLMYPATMLADVIKNPGTPIGGNVSR